VFPKLAGFEPGSSVSEIFRDVIVSTMFENIGFFLNTRDVIELNSLQTSMSEHFKRLLELRNFRGR
jgi:hypothetical protein